MSHLRITIIGLFLSLASFSQSAIAQPLGTYRWQLQPFCNVISVTVTQSGGVYTVDGTDDRCGASGAASVVGIAFLNPSGTIGFGLTTVLPGGIPVHTDATIDPTLLNGTWSDSAGRTGTFMFTRGAGSGGSPRPAPSVGVAPASITSSHIAPAAVGAAQLAANSVSGEHVVNGSLTSAHMADAPRVASAEYPGQVVLSSSAGVVLQVNLTAPSSGSVIVNAAGYFRMVSGVTLDTGRCSITTGLTLDAASLIYVREFAADSYYAMPFAGTRTFSVAAGTHTFRLVCDVYSGSVTVNTPNMNALFIPGP